MNASIYGLIKPQQKDKGLPANRYGRKPACFLVKTGVKKFSATYLADGWAEYIHLERFPTYAPELNPDEGVWQHLKHVELRNLCCINFVHLSVELDLAIRRLRRQSDLIRSFFAGAGLDL